MIVKAAVALSIGLLLVGLLVGYLIWGRPVEPLRQEVADIKARLGEEKRLAEDLQRKVSELEAEVVRTAESLRAEREAKTKLEELVSRGKK